MKKTLKEIAKLKGKELFIEDYVFTPSPDNVEVFDNPRLIESTSGDAYDALGVLRAVDISRYIENLNKRIYNKPLWEAVKKKGMGEVSACLSGHPEDEGNPSDIMGVWRGLEVGDKTPTSDLYIIDEKMMRAAKAGLPIGFSTVGFGELGADGKTVVAETFELSRHGDWVLQPSQQVYATIENLTDIDKSNKTDLSIKESFTNKNNEKEEENMTVKDTVTEANFIEAQFKNAVRIEIKESKRNENYSEALENLNNTRNLIPAGLTDLIEKIDHRASEVQMRMDEEISNSKTKITEQSEVNTTLNKDLEDTKKQLDESTDKCTKLEAIVEKLNVEEIDVDKAGKLVEEMEIAKNNIEIMETDIGQYEKDTELRDYDSKCLLEDRENMQSDIDQYTILFEEMEVAAKTLEQDLDSYKTVYTEAVAHIRLLEESIQEKFGHDVTLYVEKKATKEAEDDKEKDKDDKEKDTEKPEDKDKEKDTEKPEDKDKDKEKDMDDKEKEESDKKKKKESLEFSNNNVVLDYYNKIVEDTPSIEDIKKEILESTSLLEATEKVSLFSKRGESDDTPIIISKKKTKRPAYLEGRR